MSPLSAATHHFGRYLWKGDSASLGFPLLGDFSPLRRSKERTQLTGCVIVSVNMATAEPRLHRKCSARLNLWRGPKKCCCFFFNFQSQAKVLRVILRMTLNTRGIGSGLISKSNLPNHSNVLNFQASPHCLSFQPSVACKCNLCINYT